MAVNEQVHGFDRGTLVAREWLLANPLFNEGHPFLLFALRTRWHKDSKDEMHIFARAYFDIV